MRSTASGQQATIDIMVKTVRYFMHVQGKCRKDLYAGAGVSKTTGDAIMRGGADVSMEKMLAAYHWANGTHLALALQEASIRNPATAINSKYLLLLGPEHEDALLRHYHRDPQNLLLDVPRLVGTSP